MCPCPSHAHHMPIACRKWAISLRPEWGACYDTYPSTGIIHPAPLQPMLLSLCCCCNPCPHKHKRSHTSRRFSEAASLPRLLLLPSYPLPLPYLPTVHLIRRLADLISDAYPDAPWRMLPHRLLLELTHKLLDCLPQVPPIGPPPRQTRCQPPTQAPWTWRK